MAFRSAKCHDSRRTLALKTASNDIAGIKVGVLSTISCQQMIRIYAAVTKLYTIWLQWLVFPITKTNCRTRMKNGWHIGTDSCVMHSHVPKSVHCRIQNLVLEHLCHSQQTASFVLLVSCQKTS